MNEDIVAAMRAILEQRDGINKDHYALIGTMWAEGNEVMDWWIVVTTMSDDVISFLRDDLEYVRRVSLGLPDDFNDIAYALIRYIWADYGNEQPHMAIEFNEAVILGTDTIDELIEKEKWLP